MFSCGCIAYYTLTKGKHPFGAQPDREYNILRDNVDLSALDHLPVAQELVRAMIHKNPNHRISARDARQHPLFWDDNTSLSFLQDVSDRVVKSKSFALCSLMETDAVRVVGKAWDCKLDKELLTDLGRYRTYNFTSVCDCLRVIRNKKNHYLDLSPRAKEILGSLPSGFLRYFQTRFPRLLIHSYITMASYYCSREQQQQHSHLKQHHSHLKQPHKRLDGKSSVDLKVNANIEFETFTRYYCELSQGRLMQLSEMNKMLPCRGWWPRADVWVL